MKRQMALVGWALILFVLAGCGQASAGLSPQTTPTPEPQAQTISQPPAEPQEEMPPLPPKEPEEVSQTTAETAENEKPETYEVISVPALTLEEVRSVRFADVPASDERADYISYAACRSWMQGVDHQHFDPDGFVTRSGLVTALYRMSGQTKSQVEISFPDVDPNAWYAGAVSWAAETGITAGAADGSFYPEKQVTREQLAVFLYRFAACGDGQTFDPALPDYQDGSSILDYARVPMAWALQNGIFAGMISDTIHRSLPVSRAQLAQALTAAAACSAQEPVAMELASQLHTAASESVSQKNHETIQQEIDRIAAKYGAVGLQAAVIEDGRLSDVYAFGWATRGVDKMTPDHKIRIASLTKAGIGIAAMVLYEDGVVDLDESIGTYWDVETKNPYYPNDPVTIRTLLTHTSSIPALEDGASRTRGAVLARLQSNSYSRTRPGAVSSWAYNNYAYGVLGQTLELAAGKYLDDVMNERLWSLMEIDAAFESGNIHDKSLLATVYQSGGIGRSASSMAHNVRRGEPGATGIYFSGGMTISARDMGKLTALLANDGCYEGLHLLKKSTVDTMETRCESQLEDGSWQALALRSQDNLYGRDRLYYHTGSAYGVFNWISYDPDARDGVVVLSTGASGGKDSRNIYAVCGEISACIYDIIA